MTTWEQYIHLLGVYPVEMTSFTVGVSVALLAALVQLGFGLWGVVELWRDR